VENTNLAGVTIEAIPSRAETGVTVSRHRRAGETEVRAAAGTTLLQPGDSIVAVGSHTMLDQFQRVVGRQSAEDLRLAPGNLAYRRIVVTNKDVLGRTVGDLALDARCGAVVSRVTRADIELTAVPGLRLQFGDMVQVVGDDESLKCAEKLLGNSVKEPNETHFIPLFIGIFRSSSAQCRSSSPASHNRSASGWRAVRFSWRCCSVASDALDGSCATCQ
jgi:putative transport protein